MRYLVLVAMLCGLWATDAEAAPRRPRRQKARPPAPSGPVQIPIEIGAGPIALVPSPPGVFDQVAHFGLMIEVAAVVDQALIRQHKNQIPPWARAAAGNVTELKVRPWWLAIIPDTLVISPQFKDTGMYGAIWRPFGVGVPLVDQPGFKLTAGAALDAVALFVHSSVLGVPAGGGQSYTLVLRPGINLRVSAEVPLGDSVRLSGGWSSDLFIPQPYGRLPWELAPLDVSLWHLGGPYLMLAWRFPLDVGAF